MKKKGTASILLKRAGRREQRKRKEKEKKKKKNKNKNHLLDEWKGKERKGIIASGYLRE